MAQYLTTPTFTDPQAGPMIDSTHPHYGREPSLEQIAARARAIRLEFPRLRHGESAEPFEVPVVPAAALFGSTLRMVFDEKAG